MCVIKDIAELSRTSTVSLVDVEKVLISKDGAEYNKRISSLYHRYTQTTKKPNNIRQWLVALIKHYNNNKPVETISGEKYATLVDMLATINQYGSTKDKLFIQPVVRKLNDNMKISDSMVSAISGMWIRCSQKQGMKIDINNAKSPLLALKML